MPRPVPQFHGFVGQKDEVDLLRHQLNGALALGGPFPDTAFYGPSGIGKTKLATALAAEYGTRVRKVMGHLSRELLVGELKRLEACDFFLVDEAHNLTPPCQEILFHVIDERIVLSPTYDTSPSVSKNSDRAEEKIKLCTVILATDRPGSLCNALLKRMTIEITLGHYTNQELREIVDRLASDMDMLISPQAARLVAQVSGCLPRRAKHHLANLRRHLPEAINHQISLDQVRRFLADFGIDDKGLSKRERKYLSYLAEIGSASLESLALFLGLDIAFVRQQLEPLLQRHRLIVIGGGGRKLTPAGQQWIEGTPKKSNREGPNP